MKFSHIADCHIGSWRDEKLNNLSTEAFIKALNISVEEKVDFILMAGDIFNTSLPAIEKLKAATKKLREVKEANIPVYIIPGSHDFSPSGKTMLDVLEHAGLFINVVKGTITEEKKLQLQFTINKKTGAKITGLLGKKGSLEKKYYENLDPTNLENEDGFKIFMFHTALQELKPTYLAKMEANPVSFLPKSFDYYAGGHVHIVKHANIEGYKNIVYPGPLFPNSFSELEKLKHGGFYIYNNGNIDFRPIILHRTESIHIKANHEPATMIEKKLREQVETINAKDAIVTIRITGELSEGKVIDIDFKSIRKTLEDEGAYFVMKNTGLLKTKDFEEIKIQADNTEAIEQKIIDEHLGQFQSKELTKEEQRQLTSSLLRILDTEKIEGERVLDFEDRIRKEVSETIKIKL
jgi:DNA repair protein SbcD/Mre11